MIESAIPKRFVVCLRGNTSESESRGEDAVVALMTVHLIGGPYAMSTQLLHQAKIRGCKVYAVLL